MVITVQKLTADDLDALYDDLEESGGQRQQGLSPKTVANIHGIIHKALADAVKRGKVGVNVADIVDAPRSSRTRPQVWEANQLRCFLRHVSEDRICAAWLLWSTRNSHVRVWCPPRRPLMAFSPLRPSASANVPDSSHEAQNPRTAADTCWHLC